MTPRSDPMGPTSVYWLYDSDNRILYVGCSARFTDRIATHAKKHWGASIVRVETKTYPSRRAALAAEVAEIRRLDPPHNVMFTTRENNPVHLHVASMQPRT